MCVFPSRVLCLCVGEWVRVCGCVGVSEVGPAPGGRPGLRRGPGSPPAPPPPPLTPAPPPAPPRPSAPPPARRRARPLPRPPAAPPGRPGRPGPRRGADQDADAGTPAAPARPIEGARRLSRTQSQISEPAGVWDRPPEVSGPVTRRRGVPSCAGRASGRAARG